MDGELGTIEEGKLADLLVVDGDPLEDIAILQDRAHLSLIMKGGELVKNQLPETALTGEVRVERYGE